MVLGAFFAWFCQVLGGGYAGRFCTFLLFPVSPLFLFPGKDPVGMIRLNDDWSVALAVAVFSDWPFADEAFLGVMGLVFHARWVLAISAFPWWYGGLWGGLLAFRGGIFRVVIIGVDSIWFCVPFPAV